MGESILDTLKLETRVALSRNAQPVWFRVVKWAVIIVAVVRYWRASHFWSWMAAALAVSLGLHLFWRMKTKRWTQPWGGWDDVAATRRAPTKRG